MANRQYQQMNPEENANYYQESCKLYLANVLLTCQLKELLNEKNELLDKIERLEKSQKRRTAEESNNGIQGGGSNSNFANDKKRIRRAASQIERNYRCPVANCEKSYGSENSLIQHVKIKHPEADIKQVISQINMQFTKNKQISSCLTIQFIFKISFNHLVLHNNKANKILTFKMTTKVKTMKAHSNKKNRKIMSVKMMMMRRMMTMKMMNELSYEVVVSQQTLLKVVYKHILLIQFTCLTLCNKSCPQYKTNYYKKTVQQQVSIELKLYNKKYLTDFYLILGIDKRFLMVKQNQLLILNIAIQLHSIFTHFLYHSFVCFFVYLSIFLRSIDSSFIITKNIIYLKLQIHSFMFDQFPNYF
ncbi:transmembrane protein, putative (macronuclear) [Tetrahymena thermophila SB210]|uniref:Transmembrane protein, putative n=1 Tax=Tetrahymena thermophila (strain SB210) TaxID=312017 RepID=I7MFV3_TETTS|nr:transmembrane protein, putative [Tetrahymena thermophila SB210]EAR84332.3 transmembrane protein, putative [Tetrahymena thermophila SB210]|eukprot:XP_001031995.3 transmembrane protein, putative [Tetrahymena thermophila SB210]